MSIMEEIYEEKLTFSMHIFQKDKSPRLDGWTIELFLDLYDILGLDLLVVVEESRNEENMHLAFNSTFFALIPKTDDPRSFSNFRPISLCNKIYKIMAKIIASRLKPILSMYISVEQFAFLEGMQLHEVIGVAHEGLHSIKTRNMKGEVIKIDRTEAFYCVIQIFLRLLLTHAGFNINFINQIMSCIYIVSFVVLINDSNSLYFHA